MESSSMSSRFRFRDHQGTDNSTDSYSTSSISSILTNNDDESDLESMTGKGIKRLCTELLEIKAASDEAFHKNIFANCSAFVGVFEEVKDMEKELMQLRTQVSTQKGLVQGLINDVYLKFLSEEAIDSIIVECECDEPPNDLEAHINDILEALDILLSENRIDEAIAIIEIEKENLQQVQLEGKTPSDVLMLYKSIISEREAMLTLQLTLVAENSRIAAPELQKALVGLCRLGDSHLATRLLLKYYHSRLATGIHNLQSSKSFLQGMYIRELSKFVFSMIYQAARSFVMLYGETSPYAPEFIQWVDEEVEVFVVSFTKYVKSILEISGGLSTAVESIQFAMSYCSLLETQRLVLWPCLIKYICPCMEEILQMHIGHFKKVIGIFAATDAWVLGRYLVSGILDESNSSMVVGQQPDYCLLTNSARKFVTLLQAITEDVTPLLALQMEGPILGGLMNLFTEYIAILDRALTSETNVSEKGGSRIISAESLQQQVSILVNLSTLEHLFSSTIMSILGGIDSINSDLRINQSVGFQKQELDNCVLFIQEASSRLRANFCEQFIYRVVSCETGCKLTPATCIDSKGDPDLVNDVMPSMAFQVLFLELRKLDKLAEDGVFQVDYLMELSRELIEAVFVWISNNKEIWEINEKNITFQHSDVFTQFFLDVHFLVEIIRHGEYFSENPSVPATFMKSAFISAGLDPSRDVNDDESAIKASTEAIQRLLEIEKTQLPSNDEVFGILGDKPPENHSEHANETVQDGRRDSSADSLVLEEDVVGVNAEESTLNTELSHPVQSSDIRKDKGSSVDGSTIQLIDTSGDLEDIGSKNVAYGKYHAIQETNLPQLLLSACIGEPSEVGLPTEEGARSQHDEAEFFVNRIKDDAETNVPGTEIASAEDFGGLGGHDETNNLETVA